MQTEANNHLILVVDDDAANVHFLERLLSYGGYSNVITANSGTSALGQAIENQPDLILLDLHMPGIDGYEVLDILRASGGSNVYLPILVFTADITNEARRRALELGASDFLTKPGDAQEILLRVKNFLVVRELHQKLADRNNCLEQMVSERTKELEASQYEIIERLAQAGERRDDATGEHTRRVSRLSSAIARSMNCPTKFVHLIELASRLHDLGKIGVPDSILLKPGKLTNEEFGQMQLHCMTGALILSEGKTPLLQMAERIARSHHERFDGTGYPDRLAGEDIPVEARIVTVADVYDALTHVRPYKHAWTPTEAIFEITSQSGKQFDPDVVKAFIDVMEHSDLLFEFRGQEAKKFDISDLHQQHPN